MTMNFFVLSFFAMITDRETVQNQIKYRFAEDGNPEHQFTLARSLLGEEGDGANYEQAIFWLIRAASQGHDEAFCLLADCQKTGKGITEANESDVCDILLMDESERAARRAAKEVFNYLSNGDKYISATQLERKLRDIYKLNRKCARQNQSNGAISNGSCVSEPLQLSPSLGSGGRRNGISEANLIAAAVNYTHGQIPFEASQIVISVPNPGTLDHVPFFHRAFFNPVMFFLLLYHRFINLASSLPGTVFSNVQLLLALMIYFLFTIKHWLQFIPIAIYFITFGIMTIATFKILKKKHEFVDFRLWSGLFLRYGDHQVDAAASENRFLRNNIGPFLVFFVAFIINLTVYPLIEWLPNSELTVISFVMSFVTLFAFMYTTSYTFPDYSVLVSFGLNVLAKYPYELDSVVMTGWRFLDLKVPAFTTFVIGNGIEFCLNCRALLYLTIPGSLLYLASRENWRGIWKYFLPHCITLSWLQLCIISSQSATMFGLVRAALGLSGMLLFLPLFGLATILIPIFATIEWLSLTDPTLSLMTAIITTLLAIGGSCFLAGFNRTERYITGFQVCICITAIIFLTFPFMHPQYDESESSASAQSDLFHAQSTDPSILTSLSWEQYHRYCNQPAWEKGVSKVKTQIRCSHLDGTRINWDGVVDEIEISAISNFRMKVIQSIFPEWLANWVICFFGDLNQDDCIETEECDQIKNVIDNKCNLDKWNS